MVFHRWTVVICQVIFFSSLSAATIEPRYSRQLLQTFHTVTLNHTVPNSVAAISQTFRMDLSDVFSGDFQIATASTPAWLLSDYVQLPSLRIGSSAALAISDSFAFIGSATQLLIVNITDRVSPVILGAHNFSMSFRQFRIYKNMMYATTYDHGVVIFNISDPLQPVNISSITYKDTSAQTNCDPPITISLSGDGSVLFLKDASGVRILNVISPEYPSELSTFPLTFCENIGYEMAVTDTTLFIPDEYIEVHIVDITDLQNPVEIFNYVNEPLNYGCMKTTAIVGSILYTGGCSFEVFNVTDLYNHVPLSSSSFGNVNIDHITIVADVAFLVGEADSQQPGYLHIVDISDPVNPRLLARHAIGGSAAVGEKGVLYLRSSQGNLEIFDLQRLILTGTPTNASVSSVVQLIVFDNSLTRVLETQFQLQIVAPPPKIFVNSFSDQSIYVGTPISLSLDIRDLFKFPQDSFLQLSLESLTRQPLPAWLSLQLIPFLVSSIVLESGNHNSIFVEENRGYVLEGPGAVTILDFSDLSNPQTLIWKYQASGASASLAVNSNTLVIPANGFNPRRYLAAFNTASLSNFTVIDQIDFGDLSEVIYHMIFFQDFFILASMSDGFRIVNVSDPTNLQQIYSSSDYSNSKVAFVRDSIIVLCNNFTISFVDMSNLSQPILLSSIARFHSDTCNLAISNNLLFVAGQVSGLFIFNTSNTMNASLLGNISGYFTGVAASDTVMYLSDIFQGLQVFSTQDPTNPKLLGSLPADVISVAGFSPTAVLLLGQTALSVLNLTSWQFDASPSSTDDQGNYRLAIRATDKFGSSTSIPFTIRVEGPPRLGNSTRSIPYAKVDSFFSYTIPLDTFSDPNQDLLTYSLDFSSLPSWLSFNPISVTLSGSPHSDDVGDYSLRVNATDPLGGTVAYDFNITVVYVPLIAIPITQPLACVQNQTCVHNISANTFNSRGFRLNYSLTLNGNGGLPDWLHFDPQTLVLSGMPAVATTLFLTLTAQNANGDSVSTPISLVIAPSLPPQVRQLISVQNAFVRQPFSFPVPENTIFSPNQDPLIFSASLAEDKPLPEWLIFDSSTLLFSGQPSGSDTGTSTNPFAVRVLTVVLHATDQYTSTSVSVPFNINVGGNSNAALAIQLSASLTSVLTYLWLRQRLRKHRIRFIFADDIRTALNLEYYNFMQFDGAVFLAKMQELKSLIKQKSPGIYSKLTRAEQHNFAICVAEVLVRNDLIRSSNPGAAIFSYVCCLNIGWNWTTQLDGVQFDTIIDEIVDEILTTWRQYDGQPSERSQRWPYYPNTYMDRLCTFFCRQRPVIVRRTDLEGLVKHDAFAVEMTSSSNSTLDALPQAASSSSSSSS